MAAKQSKVVPIKPVPVNEYYDNTMLAKYKKCPRLYYLSQVRGWRSEGTAMALIFGLSWHAGQNVIWSGYGKISNSDLVNLAMEAFWDTWIEEGLPGDKDWTMEHEQMHAPRTPGVAKEMYYQYIIAREHILKKMKLEAAERPFAAPIFPDQPNVWYIGRMDKQISFEGDRILIEHKTTSLYKKDGGFQTSYIEGWSPNSQCEGYLYQSKMDKHPARYVWVDAALVHKTVHDKFKFIPIAASGASLDAFLWEMRDWVMRIRSEVQRLAETSNPKNTHMTAFPKNTEECQGKYGLCGFISVCRSNARPDLLKEPPPGFKYEPWSPFDILEMEKIGMKK